jgi:hypothetical protein
VTAAAGPGRPRRWTAGLAWALWLASLLCLAVVPWMDRLTIRAGRPELASQWQGSFLLVVLAFLITTTVGALVASRRPRHPVGWLLLGFALSQTASGVISSYVTYGLLVRPGALPAAAGVARYYPATGAAALALLSLVLLLTPTGSLPSARWRWWAWSTAATPVALVLVVAVAPGRLDPQLLLASSPFSDRALGGVLLVATRVALVVTALAVVVAAGSLVLRFRRAQGVERQQLRWVALGAALMVLAVPVVLVPVALGIPIAIASMTWTGSSAARWPMACSPCCWVAATPWSSLGWVSSWAGTLPWWWPGRPWRWPRCSSRPAAASRPRSTAASTAAATTPPRGSPRSAIGCTSRSTWTP